MNDYEYDGGLFDRVMAADLCGKTERLKPSYSITEAGQDARVSMLTGRPAAHRITVSAVKTYSLLLDYGSKRVGNRPGLPAVTIREPLRATLRHRPDRIVGEVRGGEAYDLLQALNTGHAGTLFTVHANSAEQALARFSSCVVQSGIELPYQAVRYQIADMIHLVLHLGRHEAVAWSGN